MWWEMSLVSKEASEPWPSEHSSYGGGERGWGRGGGQRDGVGRK